MKKKLIGYMVMQTCRAKSTDGQKVNEHTQTKLV